MTIQFSKHRPKYSPRDLVAKLHVRARHGLPAFLIAVDLGISLSQCRELAKLHGLKIVGGEG